MACLARIETGGFRTATKRLQGFRNGVQCVGSRTHVDMALGVETGPANVRDKTPKLGC